MSRPHSSSTKYIKNSIPAIYQNNFLELTIWAWVQALRSQGITVIEAAQNYRTHFGLTEDEAPLSNLLMIYHRKHKEFINIVRSEGRVLQFAHDAVHTTSVEAILEMMAEMLKKSNLG